MAEPKTKKNTASVHDFLKAVEDPQKRADGFRLLEIMSENTGDGPAMWGPSIIGFGTYHFVYASGREGDWMLTGFSPRKKALTLYIMSGFNQYDEILSRLGTYSTGKSCLYIKRLSDIDETVLRELIEASCAHLKEKHGS